MLFIFAALAFVAVASGVEEPIDEGLILTARLLEESRKAVSDHKESDPCAGLLKEQGELKNMVTTRTAAVRAATSDLKTVNKTITTKTTRQRECANEITTARAAVAAQRKVLKTMTTSLANASAAWDSRITETQKAIDQIVSFQQLVIQGKKLSLLQSSLLQVKEQVSPPIANILNKHVTIAKHVSSASLNPSMIEKGDSHDLLKQLFQKLKKELEIHLAKLQSDKKTEQDALQEEVNSAQGEVDKAKQKEDDLEKEAGTLATELADLNLQSKTAASAVETATKYLEAAKKDLAKNEETYQSCQQKYTDDLKALEDEHKTILSIRAKLTAWKRGGPDALDAENVKKVSVLNTPKKVTCTTSARKRVTVVKYNNQEIKLLSGAGKDKVFSFVTVEDGVLEIIARGKGLLNNERQCSRSGFAIVCSSEDKFWGSFDSSHPQIQSYVGKHKRMRRRKRWGNDGNWQIIKGKPCTSTADFVLQAKRDAKKIWAGPHRWGKFKMGPSVAAP